MMPTPQREAITTALPPCPQAVALPPRGFRYRNVLLIPLTALRLIVSVIAFVLGSPVSVPGWVLTSAGFLFRGLPCDSKARESPVRTSRIQLGIWLAAAFTAVAPLQAQPTLHGVVNATGYQAKLAPDTVFVIFGENMGPAAVVLAAGPNYPAALAGTSISFTPADGGAAIPARMYYTLGAQVSGILPSSIPPGDYEVRVSYNGQNSEPLSVTVVARSFGIATADSSGAGPAQATIGNENGGISLVRYTGGSVAFGGYTWTLRPSYAGDTLVLWGTGGGGDAANDSGGTSGDQTAAGNFFVLVGGRRITPLYAAASSGYPGLWQINFTLPADIEPGCYQQLQVSAGGELSNTATLAIAAAGQASCADSSLTPDVLSKLDAGGSIVGGAIGLLRVVQPPVVTYEYAAGAFYRWTAAQWAGGAGLRPNLGQCTTYDKTYPLGETDPVNPSATLDAGARLPLSGPGLLPGVGLVRMEQTGGPSYELTPTVGTLKPGTYTLSGTGGSEVGSFNASVAFPTDFTVTNWDQLDSVDRGQPLTLNWTGAGVDYVTIDMGTPSQTGSLYRNIVVTCLVPGGPGTFSVPVSALGVLLPSANAYLNVQGHTFVIFKANLVAGGQIDFGSFGAGINLSKSVVVH